jgi:hypothetical protein
MARISVRPASSMPWALSPSSMRLRSASSRSLLRALLMARRSAAAGREIYRLR